MARVARHAGQLWSRRLISATSGRGLKNFDYVSVPVSRVGKTAPTGHGERRCMKPFASRDRPPVFHLAIVRRKTQVRKPRLDCRAHCYGTWKPPLHEFKVLDAGRTKLLRDNPCGAVLLAESLVEFRFALGRRELQNDFPAETVSIEACQPFQVSRRQANVMNTCDLAAILPAKAMLRDTEYLSCQKTR